MKNLSFLYSLLVVLICICTTKSFAHDIEVKNIDGVTIYYSWRNNVTELAVDYFGIDDYEPIRGFYSGEVFIPESVEYGGKKYKVTAIYDCAFMHCMGLTSVTIPNSVTFIGDRAFGGCSSLTSVTIPNGVTFISSEVFGSCGGLISIKVDSGNQTYDSRNNCNAIIETLSNTLIAGCKNTIIPNTVTSIGNEAFYGCNSLTSATIPSSVTTIGNNAFHGCSGLSSVAIPNSVTSIGSWAFSGCSGLTSVAIPNSVTSIGFRAFNFCSELASVISEIANPFEIDNSVFDGIPSDAQLIVPKGTKAKYQVTAGWNQFSNIIEADSGGANLSINGINYQISSESEHTIMVSKGDYGQLLDVPATISYGNNTWSVNGVKDGALDDCNELAAIIWNPSIAFNARVSNPNLLLYVKDKAYKSPDIKNVVVNGVAESIELTDAASGNDFYCPRAFTARKISYTHDYKMETGIGESKGWETIVLPFDVQKYTHATKGEIEPFTTWTMGSNKKPFWLFELAEDGYRDVAGIKANTPYIISMPNNRQYEQQYHIPGIVTFSATNVEVQKSDDLKSVNYQGRTFVPSYTNKTDENCLALNVNSYYVTNSSKDKDGSKFIRGLRAVHPFEAYMTATDGTRSIDVLDGMTTAIKDISMIPDDTEMLRVYDTKGVLVKTVKADDDLRSGLAAGIYIVNGKKMIIK